MMDPSGMADISAMAPSKLSHGRYISHPTSSRIIICIASNIDSSKLENRSMVSPARFRQVYCLVSRPPLSHVLGPYPEGPCARDALQGHVPPLCDYRTVVTKCKFCCFFTELWLPTNRCIH